MTSKTKNKIISTAEIDADAKVAKGGKSSNNIIYIASSLALGIKFDDVPNGNGGTKTVVIPGVNHALRGTNGILLGPGNAVLVPIEKDDWEAIKKMHGREKMFVSVPPLVREFKSESDFKAARDEIRDVVNGCEPIDPNKEQGIQPSKSTE